MKKPYGYIHGRPVNKQEFKFWAKMYIGGLAYIVAAFILYTSAHILRAIL